jgi:hypothetical protein
MIGLRNVGEGGSTKGALGTLFINKDTKKTKFLPLNIA